MIQDHIYSPRLCLSVAYATTVLEAIEVGHLEFMGAKVMTSAGDVEAVPDGTTIHFVESPGHAINDDFVMAAIERGLDFKFVKWGEWA